MSRSGGVLDYVEENLDLVAREADSTDIKDFRKYIREILENHGGFGDPDYPISKLVHNALNTNRGKDMFEKFKAMRLHEAEVTRGERAEFDAFLQDGMKEAKERTGKKLRKVSERGSFEDTQKRKEELQKKIKEATDRAIMRLSNENRALKLDVLMLEEKIRKQWFKGYGVGLIGACIIFLLLQFISNIM